MLLDQPKTQCLVAVGLLKTSLEWITKNSSEIKEKDSLIRRWTNNLKPLLKSQPLKVRHLMAVQQKAWVGH